MKKQQFPLEDLDFNLHKNSQGVIHLPCLDASDSLDRIHNEEELNQRINEFLKQWRYTEVIFDPKEVWSRRIKIVNDDYNLAQSEYNQSKFDWCNENTNE